MNRFLQAQAFAVAVAIIAAVATASFFAIPRLKAPPAFVPFFNIETTQVWTLVVFIPEYSDPKLAAIVTAADSILRRKASEHGAGFSIVGVSMDWLVERGLDQLEFYGDFDEIIVGRNWLNTAATEYIWRDHPGRSGVPQMVLVGHRLRIARRAYDHGRSLVLARRAGDELVAWKASNFALDISPSALPPVTAQQQ